MITKLMAIVLIGVAALAQEKPSKAPEEAMPPVVRGADASPNADARRFLFTLVELENGRKLSSRSFEMFVREDRNSSIKTGSRVPVLGNAQQVVDYIEVGLNARVQYKLRADGKMDLNSNVEMSSIATSPTSEPSIRTPPVVRQTQSNVTTVLAPDTPTVIDRIEDLASGHTFELSVVARAK